jgi:DNA-binding GntR family transcriptional regulator
MTENDRRNGAARERFADTAYREILRRIALGQFHPSYRITEPILCEMLKMSRTPVREAINRLVADGLLIDEPHRGVRLRALTMKDMTDLLSVREAIDVEAARLAAPRITDEQIENLREICRAMDGEHKEKSELQWLDTDFHMSIVEMSGNRMLTDLYHRNHLLQMSIFGFYRAALFIQEVWGGELGRQHMPLVDALATHNPEKAEAGAREVMRLARENYFKALKLMEEREKTEGSDISAVVDRLAGERGRVVG